MNDTDDHIPAFDDAAREHEWLAQERALRRERLQLDPAGDDARSRRYRLLARVLREPPGETLPADFAQRVAERAAAASTRQGAPGPRFEFVLMLALATALIVAAGMVTMIYGSAWLPSFRAVLPAPHTPATGWLLILAGCLGASWLIGQSQRRA